MVSKEEIQEKLRVSFSIYENTIYKIYGIFTDIFYDLNLDDISDVCEKANIHKFFYSDNYFIEKVFYNLNLNDKIYFIFKIGDNKDVERIYIDIFFNKMGQNGTCILYSKNWLHYDDEDFSVLK